MEETHWSNEISEVPADSALRAGMTIIERREWWLWIVSVAVALLLTSGIASFVFAPAFSQSDRFALVSLGEASRGLLGIVVLFYVYVVCEQVQINGIRRELTEKVYQLSVLDSLTDLFNRRHIEERLTNEMARAQRYGHPLTVMLFDLNSFKRINDTYGHPSGDRVLRAFADGLKKATRGSDVAGRFGGDEFLAVLPECKQEVAQHVLDRLQKIGADVGGQHLRISYAVGCAEYIPGEAIVDFLQRADTALYEDKRGPRHLPRVTTIGK